MTLTFRPLAPAALAVAIVLSGCRTNAASELSADERRGIEETLRRKVMGAYDLSKPDVVANLMSLYPKQDSIRSASGGRVVTSRDSLEQGIRHFWVYVGQNMREPKWEWTSMHFNVLSPSAAVMTATYRVPHTQPNGQPHTIAGAWTATFVKRGSDWMIVQEHLSDVPAQ